MNKEALQEREKAVPGAIWLLSEKILVPGYVDSLWVVGQEGPQGPQTMKGITNAVG